MSVIDEALQQLGPGEIQQISQQLGVDGPTAERAVQTALPAMVAGIANNSQQASGSAAIEGLLGSHRNILGNLSSVLAGGGSGGSILGSIPGGHQDTVHNEVAKTSGLDPAKTKQLLAILAPIVLAVLAKRRGNADTSAHQPNVGDVLRQDAQNAQKKPGMGGILGKILANVETPR